MQCYPDTVQHNTVTVQDIPVTEQHNPVTVQHISFYSGKNITECHDPKLKITN